MRGALRRQLGLIAPVIKRLIEAAIGVEPIASGLVALWGNTKSFGRESATCLFHTNGNGFMSLESVNSACGRPSTIVSLRKRWRSSQSRYRADGP
jgi:hypothetical protein